MAARCAGLTCGEREIDRHFQLALRLHGTEAPFDMARTLLAYAERLREAGRRKDALDHASAALKGFEAVGARLWSVRAEEEVRRLGSEPEPVSESAFARLTSQECQVAQLAARGATNKEIGVHLFVSVKTVEYHLRNVYRKLGIRSRTELANVLLSDASLASV
jgi:DNA-binding NarL/FixJ family response regulator